MTETLPTIADFEFQHVISEKYNDLVTITIDKAKFQVNISVKSPNKNITHTYILNFKATVIDMNDLKNSLKYKNKGNFSGTGLENNPLEYISGDVNDKFLSLDGKDWSFVNSKQQTLTISDIKAEGTEGYLRNRLTMTIYPIAGKEFEQTIYIRNLNSNFDGRFEKLSWEFENTNDAGTINFQEYCTPNGWRDLNIISGNAVLQTNFTCIMPNDLYQAFKKYMTTQASFTNEQFEEIFDEQGVAITRAISWTDFMQITYALKNENQIKIINNNNRFFNNFNETSKFLELALPSDIITESSKKSEVKRINIKFKRKI